MIFTELSKRQREVLAAVTEAYIATGEPVGSKALTALIKNAPSSATLRSEMSELCSMGLLKQPHTSAGRVPTDIGIKLYVENLMPRFPVSDSVKRQISDRLGNFNVAPEKIPDLAGQLLSELTGLPAITCFATEKSPVIQQVEILPIGRSAVSLLLVTDDGRARNRICRCGYLIGGETVEKFKTVVDAKIKKKSITELNKGYIQNVIASCTSDALELSPLFTALYEMASEIEMTGADIKGVSALYGICGNDYLARRIIALIKSEYSVLPIFESISGNSGIILGRETGFPELFPETIVAARYNCGDKFRGFIGVIGLNRMSYDRIIPCVEYMASRLTEIMTEAQKDMED